ncbi:hypothetical protein D5018_03445, partial [Parashewanella curva]
FTLYKNTKCIVATKSIQFIFKRNTETFKDPKTAALCSLFFLYRICSSMKEGGVFITTVSDFFYFPVQLYPELGFFAVYGITSQGIRHKEKTNCNLEQLQQYLSNSLGDLYRVLISENSKYTSDSLVTICKR